MQVANVFQPIEAATTGPAPLFIRVVVKPSPFETVTGPVAGKSKVEDYVLLSALPVDLRERVKTAIQCLISQI